MKKIIKILIKKIVSFCLWIDGKIILPKTSLERWVSDKGDETHRRNYNLNKKSIVFDVGGYVGQWSSDIYSKYLCQIYVFEPVKKYYELIVGRYKRNKDIKIYNFGLSNLTKRIKMGILNDSSSFFKTSKINEKTMLVDVVDFIKKKKIDHIDLMKVNIEGGEYDLLERLIKTGWIKNIYNIQVQFHKIDENSERRMEEIQNRLSKTHKRNYYYRFVWENWCLMVK